MLTVQFLRFQLPSGGEARLVEAHKADVESCRASYQAFRAGLLVRLEDGDWLDISVWDDAIGEEAQNEYLTLERRAQFVGQLDGLLGDENGMLISSFPDPLLGREGPQLGV